MIHKESTNQILHSLRSSKFSRVLAYNLSYSSSTVASLAPTDCSTDSTARRRKFFKAATKDIFNFIKDNPQSNGIIIIMVSMMDNAI